MKFTTIVAAALPLLAAAAPKSISNNNGDNQNGDIQRLTVPETSDWRLAFAALGYSSEVHPREVFVRDSEHYDADIQGDDANQTDVSYMSEHLERRDDADHCKVTPSQTNSLFLSVSSPLTSNRHGRMQQRQQLQNLHKLRPSNRSSKGQSQRRLPAPYPKEIVRRHNASPGQQRHVQVLR